MNTQMAPPFLDPPFSSCGLCSTSFEGKLTEIDMYTGREGVKERGEGCINIVCVCVCVCVCVQVPHDLIQAARSDIWVAAGAQWGYNLLRDPA